MRIDCLIVGGGPAGATLAGLLASWGRHCVLVHDGRDRHGMPEETMLPAAARVLERCGLTSVIVEHGFFGTERHGVRWERDQLTWSSREGGERGFKVDRSVFDRALRDWAQGQGATVLDRHRVNGIPEIGQGAVTVVGPTGPQVLQAAVIAVASGRGGPGTLIESEIEAQGCETVAISRVGDGDPRYRDTSAIEAVPEGWLWWLPLRTGQVCLSAFLDGQEYRRVGRTLLASAIDHAKGPAASLTQGPLGYAAKGTPRLLTTDAPVLLVGDAVSTVDPLSSQGLEKALCSAEAAACAVNTIVERPELRSLALTHHASWERGLWHAHARQTAEFYGRQPRFPDAPFWKARRGATDPTSTEVVLPPRFRLHPQLQTRPALHRQGRHLVEEPGYGLDSETISRVGPVPLAPLVDVLAAARDLPAVLGGAARQAPLFPLPPRAVHDAVEDLYRRGFLIADEQPDSR